MVGLTDEQLGALADYASSGSFDDLQKSVMAFAEQVTKKARADLSVLERLKEELDDRELVELLFAIGIANITNRFNETFSIKLP